MATAPANHPGRDELAPSKRSVQSPPPTLDGRLHKAIRDIILRIEQQPGLNRIAELRRKHWPQPIAERPAIPPRRARINQVGCTLAQVNPDRRDMHFAQLLERSSRRESIICLRLAVPRFSEPTAPARLEPTAEPLDAFMLPFRRPGGRWLQVGPRSHRQQETRILRQRGRRQPLAMAGSDRPDEGSRPSASPPSTRPESFDHLDTLRARIG